MLLDFLPTSCWILLYIAPFTYLHTFFPSISNHSQLVGLLTFTFVIFASDLYAFISRKKEIAVTTVVNNNKNLSRPEKISVAVFFIIPILHYFFLGLPILNIFGDSKALSATRAHFTKIDGAGQIIFYLINWIMNFGSVILLVRIFLKKKYGLFGLVLAWILFYKLSSSAKLPIFIFVVCILLVIFIEKNHKYAMKLLAVALICLTLFVSLSLFRILDLRSAYQEKNSYTMTRTDPVVKLKESPIESLRNTGRFFSSQPDEIWDYLTYRTILVPVEVSNMWYLFWEDKEIHNRNLLEVLLLNEKPKGSNAVGVWAYAERFPSHYNNSINANASIDAEANSFGTIFLFGFALFYAFIRIGIYQISKSTSLGLRIFANSSLVFLSFTIFQAGLLAILFAQGIWLVVPVFFLGLLRKERKLV